VPLKSEMMHLVSIVFVDPKWQWPHLLHSPGFLIDPESHKYRRSMFQRGVVSDGATRTNRMGSNNKMEANNLPPVPGSGKGTTTSRNSSFSNVAGVDARGDAESNETMRHESKLMVFEDERNTNDTKVSIGEPTFTAMHLLHFQELQKVNFRTILLRYGSPALLRRQVCQALLI
jgi:hypothetical protein